MRKLKLEELGRQDLISYKASPKIPITVVLDNIRSAQNVGAFFRSADCFAIEQIVLCGITPRPPHKDITKTAIGATHSVDWKYESNIELALTNLKKESYTLIGIEQTTTSRKLKEYKPTNKTALVFGNEVEGLSTQILPQLDDCLEIEQYGTKHSLNVSVCCGIVLHYVSNTIRID